MKTLTPKEIEEINNSKVNHDWKDKIRKQAVNHSSCGGSEKLTQVAEGRPPPLESFSEAEINAEYARLLPWGPPTELEKLVKRFFAQEH